ncbi:MAG: hypothetical protein J6T47_03760 [Lachnospiraceae bacterium]|nr:hypothetical protein [Lachnospiraceae bacterium]
MTENYLEGEQRVCDVWAHYINNKNMTMEEATEYIRVSHALPKASAHLIFIDTLTGLSTRPKQGERYGPRSDRGTEAERLLSSLPIPQRISPFCAIPFMR